MSSRWCVRSGPVPGGSRSRPASHSSHASTAATMAKKAARAGTSRAARRQSHPNVAADADSDTTRIATAAIASGEMTSASGSNGSTPNSSDRIKRLQIAAPPSPMSPERSRRKAQLGPEHGVILLFMLAAGHTPKEDDQRGARRARREDE